MTRETALRILTVLAAATSLSSASIMINVGEDSGNVEVQALGSFDLTGLSGSVSNGWSPNTMWEDANSGGLALEIIGTPSDTLRITSGFNYTGGTFYTGATNVDATTRVINGAAFALFQSTMYAPLGGAAVDTIAT